MNVCLLFIYLFYNSLQIFVNSTICPKINVPSKYSIKNSFLLPFFLLKIETGICHCVFQACTGGGCTVSEASEATTLESAPEGIPDPVVTSPSPEQLLVQWGPPSLPNG